MTCLRLLIAFPDLPEWDQCTVGMKAHEREPKWVLGQKHLE